MMSIAAACLSAYDFDLKVAARKFLDEAVDIAVAVKWVSSCIKQEDPFQKQWMLVMAALVCKGDAATAEAVAALLEHSREQVQKYAVCILHKVLDGSLPNMLSERQAWCLRQGFAPLVVEAVTKRLQHQDGVVRRAAGKVLDKKSVKGSGKVHFFAGA
jgi:HEAT repeat protein